MDIEAVVREICAGCASKGYRVSEILAAFIARTVLESNPNELAWTHRSPTAMSTN